MYGWCTVKDVTLGVTLTQDAADRGSAQACFNLSVFYFQGKGVTIDASKSREYLAKAARLGHEEAQARLAQWEANDEL